MAKTEGQQLIAILRDVSRPGINQGVLNDCARELERLEAENERFWVALQLCADQGVEIAREALENQDVPPLPPTESEAER